MILDDCSWRAKNQAFHRSPRKLTFSFQTSQEFLQFQNVCVSISDEKLTESNLAEHQICQQSQCHSCSYFARKIFCQSSKNITKSVRHLVFCTILTHRSPFVTHWTHQFCLKLLEFLDLLLSHRLSLARVLSNRLSRLNVHFNRFLNSMNPTAAGLHILRTKNNSLAETCQLELSSKDFVDFALLKREDAATVEGVFNGTVWLSLLEIK